MALTTEDLQAIRAMFKEELDPINERLTKIELTQENVTNKNISLLMENQQDTNRKLDDLTTTVNEMAPTVKALDILHQLQDNVIK